MRFKVQLSPGHFEWREIDGCARSVLLTGGIGDFFAVDSLLSVEERESIETIYYATYCWKELGEILHQKALLSYPALRTHVILPTGRKVYYSAEEVAKDCGAIEAEDLSIGKVFASERSYSGSSVLLYSLAKPSPFTGPYVAVVPCSDWGQEAGRDFNAADWRVLTDFLEEQNLIGVMLYKGNKAVAGHERLMLYQGWTLAESIEILKGASGYLGIDSCLSILAAKLFPANRLAVKAVADFTYKWAHRYYAPRKDFSFVQRALKAPSWEGGQ